MSTARRRGGRCAEAMPTSRRASCRPPRRAPVSASPWGCDSRYGGPGVAHRIEPVGRPCRRRSAWSASPGSRPTTATLGRRGVVIVAVDQPDRRQRQDGDHRGEQDPSPVAIVESHGGVGLVGCTGSVVSRRCGVGLRDRSAPSGCGSRRGCRSTAAAVPWITVPDRPARREPRPRTPRRAAPTPVGWACRGAAPARGTGCRSRPAGGRAGTARGGLADVGGALERDDAREAEVRAALEALRASSGPPVKQWKTVRSGTPSASRTSNVSAHASRVWITKRQAELVGQARSARRTRRAGTSRGEWS